GNAVDVMFHSINYPILVVGTHKKHFWFIEQPPVSIGVNHLSKCAAAVAFYILYKTKRYIVLYLWTIFLPHFDLVVEVDRHIKNIDDHRCERFHPSVLRSGQPGCPAALG